MQEKRELEPQISLGAFKKVFDLNKLCLESGQLTSRQELIFFILNQTIRYAAFNRAMLWDGSGKTRCLGISGNAVFDGKSPVLIERGHLIDDLVAREEFQILTASSFSSEMEPQWRAVQSDHSGSSVLWCPIIWDGHFVAALWLERWGGGEWNAADRELVKPLMSAYASAWRPYLKERAGFRAFVRNKRNGLIGLLVLLLLLVVVRVPLRIVAPCEVVPKDPLVVAAPLDGVIDRVEVHPGEVVDAGALLYSYDKEVPMQDLKVAQQQVRLIWSDLERARAEAFANPEAKQLVALLQTRLEQEQSKLELAESYARKLEVRAEQPAVVMMGDPAEWAGRPVALGERVMQLVDPKKSKLMIWLPQDDKIDFDARQQVRVMLNARALQTQYAVLSYQAKHAEMSTAGYSAFRAEAEWTVMPDELQMGLKGHAVLYGEKVSLAYWLFRRPIAAVRAWVGR